jgi:cation diffusion facilitator family transporter
MILVSGLWIGYESISRLVNLHEVQRLWLVVGVAIVGFAGNEAVAGFRIQIGGEIGSAALIADGQHARADGLTSLAVPVGAGRVAARFPLADPLVGLLISLGILFLAFHSGREVWTRLTDAIDPVLVERFTDAAARANGMESVAALRARWIGHSIEVEATVVVDEKLSTGASHAVAEGVRHRLLHAHPRAGRTLVHVDPCEHRGVDYHAMSRITMSRLRRSSPQSRGASTRRR